MTKKMKTDKRPTALITGGSKGIGHELARQFAMHGHDLVLVARSPAELENAAARLKNEQGGEVETVALDLTDIDAPLALYKQLASKSVEIDVLVNNAGSGDVGPFIASDLERQLAMLQLNMVSLTALTRLFLPGMIERGEGRILNVASLAAHFAGGSNWSSYVASKHYVLAFSRGLAKELRASGVKVTALCPGPTATAFVGQAGAEAMPIYRWLPKIDASKVALAGYHASTAGRTVLVPGLLNKLLAFLGELPPRAIAQSVFDHLSRNPPQTKTETGRVT